MNKKFSIWQLVAAQLILCSSGVLAQLPEQMGYRKIDTPAFFIRALTFASETPGRTLLRTGMKVSNDELQFTQMEAGFQAEFEYSVLVLNSRGNQVDGRIERRTITADQFAETNAAMEFHMVESEFELEPGEYELVASVTDMDTKVSNQKRNKIKLRDYSREELEMSSILLADDIGDTEKGLDELVPNVLNNFGPDQDSLYICFEVYNTLFFDSVEVNYQIKNHKKKRIRDGSFTYALRNGRTPVSFVLTKKELLSGRYRLEIEVRREKFEVANAVEFSINWLHLMPVAADLENAVNQLKYIASTTELRKIRKAKSEEEKQERFEQFWRDRDPSPGTQKNELFEEYYRRVHYTNMTFGKYTAGWKTDMGMVFIRLGPPDEVERHPYEPETKPYQVWLYHRPPYELVFVDHSGFGEFRLTTDSIDRINRMIR